MAPDSTTVVCIHSWRTERPLRFGSDMTQFEHPTLGPLTLEDGVWTGEVRSPVFKRFKDSESGIEFELDGENLVDSLPDRLVDLAVQIINNATQLVELGLQALFDDLYGRGSNSGMWWHGNLEMVCESLGKTLAENPIESPERLYGLLGNPSIYVQTSCYRYDAPCAEFGFASDIDPEHGVGIVTDGHKIIGIGYRATAGAFE